MFVKQNIMSTLNLPNLELFVTTFIAWDANETIAEIKIMFTTNHLMPSSNKNFGSIVLVYIANEQHETKYM